MLCLYRRARIAASAAAPLTSLSPSSSSFVLCSHAIRPFTSFPCLSQKSMPSRPKPPPDSELEESYLKGSGPGGQKINKTNSAVQIKHIPTGIVVKSQATRSRSQNRKHAREILAQKLDDLENGGESRASIVGAVRKKRSDSAAKKSRRKYKKLEEDKAAAAAAGEEEGEAGKVNSEQGEETSRDATGEVAHQNQTATEKAATEKADTSDSQSPSDSLPSHSNDSKSRP